MILLQLIRHNDLKDSFNLRGGMGGKHQESESLFRNAGIETLVNAGYRAIRMGQCIDFLPEIFGLHR